MRLVPGTSRQPLRDLLLQGQHCHHWPASVEACFLMIGSADTVKVRPSLRCGGNTEEISIQPLVPHFGLTCLCEEPEATRQSRWCSQTGRQEQAVMNWRLPQGACLKRGAGCLPPGVWWRLHTGKLRLARATHRGRAEGRRPFAGGLVVDSPQDEGCP